MKSGYYHRIDNTSLAVLDICDYYPEGAGRKVKMITRINVPGWARGMGYGSTVLKKCLEDADIEGVKLFLEIQSSDGLDRDQLREWYERHGFKEIVTGMWMRKPAGEA